MEKNRLLLNAPHIVFMVTNIVVSTVEYCPVTVLVSIYFSLYFYFLLLLLLFHNVLLCYFNLSIAFLFLFSFLFAILSVLSCIYTVKQSGQDSIEAGLIFTLAKYNAISQSLLYH